MYHKKTEKKMIESEVTIESFYICDKCDKKIETSCYNAFEFKFEYRSGSSYPESGNGEETTMDLCEACSKSLVDQLKFMNYKLQTREWDW